MSRPKLTDAEMRALKIATKAVIAACGGGEAAAAVCRLGPSHLSESASVHHPDRSLPIDVVAQLEAAGEAWPVTAALARMAGCVLVPVEPRGSGDLATELARLGREVGDVFAASAHALAGGAPSEAERETLARELGEMLAVGRVALSLLAPALPMRAGAK